MDKSALKTSVWLNNPVHLALHVGKELLNATMGLFSFSCRVWQRIFVAMQVCLPLIWTVQWRSSSTSTRELQRWQGSRRLALVTGRQPYLHLFSTARLADRSWRISKLRTRPNRAGAYAEDPEDLTASSFTLTPCFVISSKSSRVSNNTNR